MAVIKFGAIVTDARGKLGGHNFSWNHGGNILQTNSNNTKRSMVPTSRQQFVAIQTAAVKKLWSDLSTSNRVAWHSAAPNFTKKDKVGNTRVSYGYEYFLRVNYLLTLAGLPAIQVPIASVPITNLGAVTTNVIGHHAATISFPTFITSDEVIVLSATRCMSLGKKPAKKDFAQMIVINDSDSNPYDFFANYIDLYGDMIADTAFYLYMYVLNKKTGQGSNGVMVACFPT